MCLYDHDVVFWFGDLNYRLNTDGKMSNEDVRRIASSEKFADLLQYCQVTLSLECSLNGLEFLAPRANDTWNGIQRFQRTRQSTISAYL